MPGNFILIYICNFHVLNQFFLNYICKLHWNRTIGHVECLVLSGPDFYRMLGTIVDKINDEAEFKVIKSVDIFKGLKERKLRNLRKDFVVVKPFNGQKILFDTNLIYVIVDGEFETSTDHKFITGGVIGDMRDGSGLNGSFHSVTDEAKVPRYI